MNSIRDIEPIRLRAGAAYRIEHRKGLQLTVIGGTVWITQAQDARDIILTRGHSFILDRSGRAVVYALMDATIVIGPALPTPRSARCPMSGTSGEDTREKMAMTAIGRPAYATPHCARLQTGPAGWMRACAAPLLRVLERQRQRRALLDLDERQLEDIGRSRDEAVAEACKPFWK